jgi:hypothetical protein
MYRITRRILMALGNHVTERQTFWMDRALSQLEVSRWFKANGIRPRPLFRDRRDLYLHLARQVADEHVLYLEFGVFEGASLRIWSEVLRNPLSSLHGFDSFEGLPETWTHRFPKGAFDTKGALPKLADPRVMLHVGWFNETLPGFVLPEHERLLVHFDADLYSSAKYVLDSLRDAIRPGTILLFDEFYDRMHELRAFSEFLEETGIKVRFLGGAKYLSQCAFERIS